MEFRDTDELKGAEFVNVDLSGVVMRNVNLQGARFKEAMLVGARFSGLIDGLVVNDVEVGPLIRAEMIRRHPERAKLRPDDAAGVREAWNVIESLWDATKDRIEPLPEHLLNERVDDEWSFLETFRHLVFVTDAWISGRVLGESKPFHRLGVAPTFITDLSPFGLDATAAPDRTEVISIREERMAIVRDLVMSVTDADLTRVCDDQTVLSCLRTVFEEEWAHNWYANRDLDALTRAD